MTTFAVTMLDRSVEEVDGADAYQQEGPMTTFFALGDGRDVVDCWSTRVASIRTAEILVIRSATGAAERHSAAERDGVARDDVVGRNGTLAAGLQAVG